MAARKSEGQVNLVRNLLLGFAALLAVAVVVLGILYSAGLLGTAATSSDAYRTVEGVPARSAGAPIVVTEYFSYGCIHCRNFDPLIEAWVKQLPDGVRFERAPVSFGRPDWSLLARAYVALEQLNALPQNHERMFGAVHDARRTFDSPEAIATFLDGRGVSQSDVLARFTSSRSTRRLNRIEQELTTLDIRSIPQLVVDGRYVINMDVGRKPSLAVVDALVAKLLAGETP